MSHNKGLLQRIKIFEDENLEDIYLENFPEVSFEDADIDQDEQFDNEFYEVLLDEAIEKDEHYIFRSEFEWEEMSYYKFEINGQNLLDYNYDEYSCGNWNEDINKELRILYENKKTERTKSWNSLSE